MLWPSGATQDFLAKGINMHARNWMILAIALAWWATPARAALVAPISASSDVGYYSPDDRSPTHTIDGTGLSADGTQHGTAPGGQQWLSAVGHHSGSLTYDLGGLFEVNGLQVWNYNETGATARGMKNVGVWTSLDGTSFTLQQSLSPLAQAPGTAGYTGVTPSPLSAPVVARYVKLAASDDYGDANYIGLAEVRVDVNKQIAVSAAAATSNYGVRYPFNTISGAAMSGAGSELLNTNYDQQWLSNGGTVNQQQITFDLGSVTHLTTAKVWNYNEAAAAAGRGIKDMTVDYSSDGSAWTSLGAFVLQKATGAAGYGYNKADVLSLGGLAGINAQYIRFNVVDNYNGAATDYVGLGQVRFFDAQIPIASWVGAASNLWADAANWDPGTAAPDGVGTLVSFSTSDATVDLASTSRTVGGLFFQASASGTTIQGAAGLALDNGGANAAVTASGTHLIQTPLALHSPAAVMVAGGSTLTFGGPVSGDKGIVKSGPGVLALSNAGSTYSGGTTINAGTVSFANGALGSGNVAFSGTATLQWEVGNTQDVSGKIQAIPAGVMATFDTHGNDVSFASSLGGPGGIVKAGDNTLWLTAANSHAGGTTINGGTLRFASGALGSGNLAFTGNGTLQWAAGNTQNIAVPVQMGNGAVGTLDTNGGDVTVSGSVSGPGGIGKTGNGVLTLSGNNGYAGPTVITQGTLKLAAPPSTLPSGISPALWLDAADTASIATDGGTFVWTDKSGKLCDAKQFMSEFQPVSGAAGINGHNAVQFDGTNDFLVSSGTYAGKMLFVVAARDTTGVTNYNGVFSARVSPNSQKADPSNSNLGFTQQGTQPQKVVSSGETASNVWINGAAVTVGDFNNSAVGVATWSSPVSGTISPPSVIEVELSGDTVGAKNAVLGADAYSAVGSRHFKGLIGEVVMYDTTLTAEQRKAVEFYLAGKWAGASPLPAMTAVQIAGGATLDLDGTSYKIGSLADHPTLGGGTVLLGAGTLTTGGDNTSTAFSGHITGSGGLVKTGAGALTLSGANDYAGGSTINGGELAFANATALPATGNVTIQAGGALVASGAHAGAAAWLASGRIPASSSGSLALAGTEGGVSLAGYDNLYLGAYGSAECSGTITPGANGYRLGGGGGTLTLSSENALTGDHDLAVGGGGAPATVVLGAANNYTGATTVNAGTLQIGHANATSNGTVTVNANNGLAFSPGLGAATLGALAGAGSFALADTGGAAVTLTVGANDADSTYSGALGGSGTLVKTGAGAMTLSNVNTFAGGATVDGGVLTLTANGGGRDYAAIGPGDLTINSGGTVRVEGNHAMGQFYGLNNPGTVTINGGAFELTNGEQSFGKLTMTGGTCAIGSKVGYYRADTLDVNAAPATSAISGASTANNFRIEKDLTINVADGQASPNLLVSANVFEFGGSRKVTKAGPGSMVLTGNNTYTGGTAVEAGTLQIGDGGVAGSVLGDITNHASLVFNRADTYVQSGAISGTGSLTQAGTGTLVLKGANTYSGATVIASGVVKLQQAPAANPLQGAGSGLQLWLDAADTATISDVGGSVVEWNDKSGNAYDATVGSGGTSPSTAAAAINGQNAISFDGLSNFLVNSGIYAGKMMFVVAARDTTGANNFNGVVSARLGADSTKTPASDSNLGFTQRGGALDRVNGCNQIATGTWVNGAAVSATDFNNSTVGVPAWSAPIFGTITPPSLIEIEVAGDAGGTKNLVIGADAFSAVGSRHFKGLIGEVLVYDATLTAEQRVAIEDYLSAKWRGAGSTGDILPGATAVQVAAGALLDLDGANQAIGSLSDHPTLGAGSVSLGNGTLTTGNDGTDTVFSGLIVGAGRLVKTGSGNFTLAGNSEYTGGTSVAGGTLEIASATALPAGASLSIGEAGTAALAGGAGTAGAVVSRVPQAVPEPATAALLAAAAAMLAAAVWRRKTV
jgi:fibronectin-binding autotransporter adhesin